MPPNARDDSTDAIVVEHVTKRYGPLTAVDDVSFEVPQGQLLALLGPNGAGKSTTIDMVLGLARPDAGRVSLFGRPPAAAIAAGLVGGMLQTGSLVEYLSVRELVTMVASTYPRPLAVGQALELERHCGLRRSPHQQAVRRADPASSFRHRPRGQHRSAVAR